MAGWVRTTLLVAVLLAPAVSGATAVHGAPAVQEQPEADNTVTRIELDADGDARWRVRIRTRLATDEDVEEFRAFQREFRNDTGRYLDPFRERLRGVASEAADGTGRSMAAGNFSASTSVQEVPRRWGVVTYEFTWTNFARTEGDAVVVGDVFAGGFFLAENDSLAVFGPDGYRVAAAEPTPDETGDGSVTWVGQRDFNDERPFARFEPGDVGPGSDSGSAGGTRSFLPVGIGLLSVLLAAGAVVYYRRSRGSAAGDGIVTDADRVRELLVENGGQLKQSDVGDALGWSDSKTSRVLSGMADDGEVEKLRIGRENVIRLGDDE